ncbi:DoxX family protein [Desertibacillus haloalkaliphilus]|uniref:DoxX family protein n=1 Tax=Desertibacillus haloalkaliphilus TaxID=1328930 RepID=UPI001C271345|nr:DoxX family protein [Desertibacillus haloalkaliphilus]MBU8908789.1 DoxX family protein [Desertibacillus haloalkaliphilus]
MSNKFEIGLVVVRVILGLTFFIHGLDKFQGGIGNTAAWFGSIGIPEFMAYVVAIIELVGGLAMILGVGVRVVAILFTCIMIGAIFTVKISGGFMEYELDLILLAVSVQLAITGSHLYSIDRLLAKKSSETAVNG